MWSGLKILYDSDANNSKITGRKFSISPFDEFLQKMLMWSACFLRCMFFYFYFNSHLRKMTCSCRKHVPLFRLQTFPGICDRTGFDTTQHLLAAISAGFLCGSRTSAVPGAVNVNQCTRLSVRSDNCLFARTTVVSLLTTVVCSDDCCLSARMAAVCSLGPLLFVRSDACCLFARTAVICSLGWLLFVRSGDCCLFARVNVACSLGWLLFVRSHRCCLFARVNVACSLGWLLFVRSGDFCLFTQMTVVCSLGWLLSVVCSLRWLLSVVCSLGWLLSVVCSLG